MPKSRSATCVKAAFAGGFHKAGYFLFVGRREIERFIEFSSAGQLGALWAQAGVVGDLTKAHVMESGDPYGAFLRDIVKRFADFRVGPPLRDTEVARGAHGAWNAQTEVAVRKEDSSAIFRYEWVVVSDFSPDRVDFFTGPRGEQDKCDFSLFEFRQRFFRACKRIRARIDQGAFQGCKDQMARGKQDV